MATFINPFTDFGFKRIFGQEDHKRILIGFLNALFEGEFVVRDLVYRDKEHPGEMRQDRTVIYDIYCTLDDGSHVIVEMQNKREVNFADRALYYASVSIVSQGRKGDGWNYKYAPVIGVFFLNYRQEELGQAFRSDFEITKTREMFAHTVLTPTRMGERKAIKPKDVLFEGKLHLVFLQMPEFTKNETECSTALDKWAYVMNHMEKLTNIPWAVQDELYAELARVSNVSALSPQERAAYEETLKQYRDNIACYEAAIEDGMKIGREESNKETARKMLARGFDIGTIAEITELSVDEIEALQ